MRPLRVLDNVASRNEPAAGAREWPPLAPDADPLEVLLVWPPFNDPRFVPLGLSYVAAAVGRAGHRARILDLNAIVQRAVRSHWQGDPANQRRLPIDDFRWDVALGWAMARLAFPDEPQALDDAALESEVAGLAGLLHRTIEAALGSALGGVDLIGVSITEPGLLGGVCVSKLARAMCPAPIVWGGTHCSRRSGPVLMRTLTVPDFVVHGDGEEPMTGLLRQMRGGCSLADVPGLIWSDGDEIRVNDRGPPVAIESIAPPDFSTIDPANYPTLALPVLASRGCAWNRCTFCSEPSIWPSVRQRTPEAVVAEIRAGVERLRPAWVSFVDTAANGRDDGISAVVDAMIAQGFSYPFGALVIAQNIDRDLMTRMRRAGCIWLFCGFEHFDDGVLRLVKKGVTWVHNLQVLKLAAEQGISIGSNIILSFPGEKAIHVRAMTERLVRYAHLFQGAIPGINHFSAQPGAEVYEKPDRYNVRVTGPATIADVFPDRLRSQPIFWDYRCEVIGEPIEEARERFVAQTEFERTLNELRDGDLPRMTFRDDPATGAVHIEIKRGAERESIALTGDERTVFLACDEIVSVRRAAAATGLSEEVIREVCSRWESKGLFALSAGMLLNTVPRETPASAARGSTMDSRGFSPLPDAPH